MSQSDKEQVDKEQDGLRITLRAEPVGADDEASRAILADHPDLRRILRNGPTTIVPAPAAGGGKSAPKNRELARGAAAGEQALADLDVVVAEVSKSPKR